MSKSAIRLAWDKLRVSEEYQQFIKTCLQRQDDKCLYCGSLLYEEETFTFVNRVDEDGDPTPPETLRFYNYVVDHVVPLSAGGSNDFDNLVVCCGSCNSRKGRKLDWKLA